MVLKLPERLDFLQYQQLNGTENMAIDEVLYHSVKRGKREGVIRLYSWNKPAITLGYFQNHHSVDIDKCRSHGIQVVRRLTGGRAVYHSHELTYSIIVKGNDNLVNKKKIFIQLSQLIIQGLNGMGWNGIVSEGNIGSIKNPNCFQATSVCEITSPDGKKLVGSALLLHEGVVLMQGSIPLSDTYLNINHYLTASQGKESVKLKLPEPSPYDHFLIEQFISGISTLVQLQPFYQLYPEEKKHVQKLIEEKYSHDSWNFMR